MPAKRNILGAISITLLAALPYLLAQASSNIASNPPFYLTLIPAVVSGLNITILFAWMAFGFFSSVAISLLCAMAVLWIDLRYGLHGYSLFILPFFVTVFMGISCRKARQEAESSYEIASGKLEEKRNVILNEIELGRKGISALEAKMERYSMLKKAVEDLSMHLSLEELDSRIIEYASKITAKPGRVLLFLVDTDRQALRLFASSREAKVMTKAGDIFDQWVLRHRQSLIVEDTARDFRFPTDGPKKPDDSFRSLIASPLISENKVIGIIRMDSPDEMAYTQDDLRLLDIIASLGAACVENALLYKKTQELSIRDSLTDLYVRRYFFERFHEEMQRSAMKNGDLSLLIIDIDHFKLYNDKYGHAAGDLVLKYLSRQINSLLKGGDIAARYGGEEIIVLLSDRDKKQAASWAESVRRSIKDKPLSFRRHLANITVSVGIASFAEDGTLEEDLVRVADKRLYKAKRAGRDRVCVS